MRKARETRSADLKAGSHTDVFSRTFRVWQLEDEICLPDEDLRENKTSKMKAVRSGREPGSSVLSCTFPASPTLSNWAHVSQRSRPQVNMRDNVLVIHTIQTPPRGHTDRLKGVRIACLSIPYCNVQSRVRARGKQDEQSYGDQHYEDIVDEEDARNRAWHRALLRRADTAATPCAPQGV